MGVYKVLAWGPLTALSIMLIVTITVLNSIEMWLPPFASLIGFLNYSVFWFLVGSMLFNFFNATLIGSGFVPSGWRPNPSMFMDNENPDPDHLSDDDQIARYLQYCQICRGFKPPRAHHCRICNRCSLKMDHHCPWINNCCGHRNHANFTLFLFFSVIGSFHSFILLSITLYRAYHASWYYTHEDPDRVVLLSFRMFLFCVLSIGLSLGVIVAVGMLFYIQLKVIYRNSTTIEDWIVLKANMRRPNKDFVYPYNLGFYQNFKQVFFGSADGITWPVIKNTHQFTLTMEQIAQKQLKREHTRPYRVVLDYSGHWVPIFAHGIRVACAFPCSDEPRLPLTVGQHVLVTRWNKRWLYGQIQTPSTSSISRGWFPRQCVVELQQFTGNNHLPATFDRSKQD